MLIDTRLRCAVTLIIDVHIRKNTGADFAVSFQWF